eukprot:g2882.t1
MGRKKAIEKKETDRQQSKAAIKIQARHRGNLARKTYEESKEVNTTEVGSEEEQNRAATKIQSRYRSLQGRRRASEVKKAQSTGSINTSNQNEIGVKTVDEDVENTKAIKDIEHLRSPRKASLTLTLTAMDLDGDGLISESEFIHGLESHNIDSEMKLKAHDSLYQDKEDKRYNVNELKSKLDELQALKDALGTSAKLRKKQAVEMQKKRDSALEKRRSDFSDIEASEMQKLQSRDFTLQSPVGKIATASDSETAAVAIQKRFRGHIARKFYIDNKQELLYEQKERAIELSLDFYLQRLYNQVWNINHNYKSAPKSIDKTIKTAPKDAVSLYPFENIIAVISVASNLHDAACRVVQLHALFDVESWRNEYEKLCEGGIFISYEIFRNFFLPKCMQHGRKIRGLHRSYYEILEGDGDRQISKLEMLTILMDGSKESLTERLKKQYGKKIILQFSPHQWLSTFKRINNLEDGFLSWSEFEEFLVGYEFQELLQALSGYILHLSTIQNKAAGKIQQAHRRRQNHLRELSRQVEEQACVLIQSIARKRFAVRQTNTRRKNELLKKKEKLRLEAKERREQELEAKKRVEEERLRKLAEERAQKEQLDKLKNIDETLIKTLVEMVNKKVSTEFLARDEALGNLKSMMELLHQKISENKVSIKTATTTEGSEDVNEEEEEEEESSEEESSDDDDEIEIGTHVFENATTRYRDEATGLLKTDKDLPRVALRNPARIATQQMELHQREEEIAKLGVRYSQCRTTCFPPTMYTSKSGKKQDTQHVPLPLPRNEAPSTRLVLEHVHGYNENACAPNIHALSTGELIYPASSMVVICNRETRYQRFYRGYHSGQISCLTLHPKYDVAASGQSGNDAFVCIFAAYSEQKGNIENVKHLKIVRDNSFKRGVTSVAFSTDGNLLCCAANDDYHTVSMWRWKTRVPIRIACSRGGTTPIKGIAFNQKNLLGFDDVARNCKEDVYYSFATCGKRHLKFWTLQTKARDEQEDLLDMKNRGKKEYVFSLDGRSPAYPIPKKEKFRLENITVNSLSCDLKGHYWCGTSNGRIMIYKQKVDKNHLRAAYYHAKYGKQKIPPKSDGKLLAIHRLREQIHGGITISVDQILCDKDNPGHVVTAEASGVLTYWNYKDKASKKKKKKNKKHTRHFDIDDDDDDDDDASMKADGKTLLEIKHMRVPMKIENDHVHSLVWDKRSGKDKLSFVLGTKSSSIMEFNMPSNSVKYVLQAHRSFVGGLATHPTLPIMSTCSRDGFLFLWGFENYSAKLLGEGKLPKEQAVCVTLSPSTNHIACGSNLGLVHIFSYTKENNGSAKASSLIEVNKFEAKVEAFAKTKNLHAIGEKHVGGTRRGPRQRRKMRQPLSSLSERPDIFSEEITCISYSPNGQYLVAGSRDKNIYVFSGHAKNYEKVTLCRSHSSYISAFDWSADSRYMMSSCGAYEILYWDSDRKFTQCRSPYDLRDVSWDRNSCKLGWSLQGIWKEGASGTSINSVHRSKHDAKNKVILVGDDCGTIRLLRWPCLMYEGVKPGEKIAPKALQYDAHSSAQVQDCQFTHNDKTVVSIGGNDECFLLCFQFIVTFTSTPTSIACLYFTCTLVLGFKIIRRLHLLYS